jgi:drug/metabolite transporter (DMT)-like permease
MGPQWLLFALMTVVSWGVYGILLHKGQVLMGDPVNGRYKAFLFVGVAYFVVAILGPLLMLKSAGATWKFTAGGINWSFWAGVVGAIGAFTTLLALGAAFKGKVANPPAVVMSIVFAGAPVVNALVSILIDRVAGKQYSLPLPFLAGIVMAAVGGFMVVKFKPVAPPDQHPAPAPRTTAGLGGGLIQPAAALAAARVAPGFVDVSTRAYRIS